jgi:aryl-alcohol dehydrogenase-like predicted oxidoreductase
LAEISIREKSGLLAYSPLAFGFLSGKYRNNNLPEGSRMKLFGDFFPRYKSNNATKAIEDYYKIAKKYNLSLAQMSLAFINSRSFVTSNIIGATTMEQLKENVGSLNIKIDKETIQEINSIHKNNPNPAP